MSERIDYCNSLIASTRAAYDVVGSVYCPILKGRVKFNARGFHHLLYDHDGTPRTANEKIYKLTLFPLAIPTIKNATSISEERQIRVKASRKKDAMLKDATQYAIVATVGRKRPVAVRVIIMQIGTGDPMFWSIMKD